MLLNIALPCKSLLHQLTSLNFDCRLFVLPLLNSWLSWLPLKITKKRLPHACSLLLDIFDSWYQLVPFKVKVWLSQIMGRFGSFFIAHVIFLTFVVTMVQISDHWLRSLFFTLFKVIENRLGSFYWEHVVMWGHQLRPFEKCFTFPIYCHGHIFNFHIIYWDFNNMVLAL